VECCYPEYLWLNIIIISHPVEQECGDSARGWHEPAGSQNDILSAGVIMLEPDLLH
jgi:hypothetical protein